MLVSVLFGAPIVGEFIFRGYLQPALAAKMPAAAALLVTSFVFAGIHFDLQAYSTLLVAGLALGYLRHASQSLLPAVLLHALFNAVGIWYASNA